MTSEEKQPKKILGPNDPIRVKTGQPGSEGEGYVYPDSEEAKKRAEEREKFVEAIEVAHSLTEIIHLCEELGPVVPGYPFSLFVVATLAGDYYLGKRFFEWYEECCKGVDDFMLRKAIEQGRGYGPGYHNLSGYIGGAFSPFIKSAKGPGSQGGQTTTIGGAFSPFIKSAKGSGSQGGQAANAATRGNYIGGPFSPFNINGPRKGAAGRGGGTADAVVHVAGGKYTFNVDKLDGPKLIQILKQIASEVRPNG